MSNKKEFDIWINSKAPMNEFGNMPKSAVTAILGDNNLSRTINNNIDNNMSVYHGDGDNTKFTPDETASSRLFMYMHVNIEEGTVSNVVAGSFGTENLKTHENSMAKPICGAHMKKGSNEYSSSVLNFKYSGSNPDKALDVHILPNTSLHIAPDIDVQGQLRFSDDKNGDLLVQGGVNGDGFPATSMFAHFGENKVMIASSPISKGGTVWDLKGGADKHIMNINLSIEFKGDTPVTVKDWNTMKEYSVEDWNKLHESTPMIESEHSKEMIIDKGEAISKLEVEKDMFTSSLEVKVNLNKEVILEDNYTIPLLNNDHLVEIESNFHTYDRDNGMDLT